MYRNNKKIEGIQEEAAKTALLDAMHKANDKALAFCMGSHGRLGEASPMARLDANLLRMIMARTYLCSDFDEGRILDDDETDAVSRDMLNRSLQYFRCLCVYVCVLRIDRLSLHLWFIRRDFAM